jgi:uncharacterized protein (TIGR02118 family)
MARLVTAQTPKQVGVFDKYYFEKHVPIAKENPRFEKVRSPVRAVVTPAGLSGFQLIANTLHFDDLAAIQRAFASAEGQVAAADVQTFAPACRHADVR